MPLNTEIMSDTLEVYRLCRKKYAGKLIASGLANRWNREGQKVLYCASSRSLASLELLVHRSRLMPEDPYLILVISVREPGHMVSSFPVSSLPKNWRSLEAFGTLQSMGTRWYEQQSTLALQIPSLIIPREYNYVINTVHPAFQSHVSIKAREEYFWDNRLFPLPGRSH